MTRMTKSVRMSTENINRENIAWAGGLFEGEGCVTLYHIKRKLWEDRGTYDLARLIIKMTDEDTVRRFRAIFGDVGNITVWKSKTQKSNHKPQYVWNLCAFEHVQAILAMIYPWLGERRKAKVLEVLKGDCSKGVGHNWVNAKNTCPNGHLYEDKNLHLDPRGGRICKECRRIKGRKAYWNSKDPKFSRAREIKRLKAVDPDLALQYEEYIKQNAATNQP